MAHNYASTYDTRRFYDQYKTCVNARDVIKIIGLKSALKKPFNNKLNAF